MSSFSCNLSSGLVSVTIQIIYYLDFARIFFFFFLLRVWAEVNLHGLKFHTSLI